MVCHPSNYFRFKYKNDRSFKDFSLPGHTPLLQLADREELPEQSLPPPDGAGLLHERDLDLVPSPQLTEHKP